VALTPLIIVSGPPASGKTTVAEFLASELGLPLLARDGIKESLFDTLGSGDVAWSRLLGGASYELLYYLVEVELRAGRSVIAESNFVVPDSAERLSQLCERYEGSSLEIHCTAAPETILARYAARAPQRHPGHHDRERAEDVSSALANERHIPLGLPGTLVVVDTSDFGAVDLGSVLAAAQTHLGQAGRVR
jgi:predicted kinase